MFELPGTVPLFPLPNLVLFPGVVVPLHIFEPRYRQMIEDVRNSHGIIGMTLLKPGWEQDYYGAPEVYSVGCAGVIERLEELIDGRFNLLLRGVSEFRLAQEFTTRPYREARVDWCPVPDSALEPGATEFAELRRLLLSAFGNQGEHIWRLINAELGPANKGLVNLLCFYLDITPLEKQALLEALSQRVACLLDMLTFKLAERHGPSGGSSSCQ